MNSSAVRIGVILCKSVNIRGEKLQLTMVIDYGMNYIKI
jgi:hypothetical protein